MVGEEGQLVERIRFCWSISHGRNLVSLKIPLDFELYELESWDKLLCSSHPYAMRKTSRSIVSNLGSFFFYYFKPYLQYQTLWKNIYFPFHFAKSERNVNWQDRLNFLPGEPGSSPSPRRPTYTHLLCNCPSALHVPKLINQCQIFNNIPKISAKLYHPQGKQENKIRTMRLFLRTKRLFGQQVAEALFLWHVIKVTGQVTSSQEKPGKKN